MEFETDIGRIMIGEIQIMPGKLQTADLWASLSEISVEISKSSKKLSKHFNFMQITNISDKYNLYV